MKKYFKRVLARRQSLRPEFWIILTVVFFDIVRFGLAMPVLPPLFLNNASHIFPDSVTFADRSLWLGIVLAAYPIAQFFGAPILGALSDQHGRKPLLLTSYIGAIVGLLVTGFGVVFGNIALMLFGRVIGGFTGGNVSVAQSAMADISTPDDKVKNFSYISMAFGLGFIVGPLMGGKFADPNVLPWFDYATPFWVASILTFLNTLLVYFLFRETINQRFKHAISPFRGITNLKMAWGSDLRTILLVTFFTILGFNFFNQFVQLSIVAKFHFTQSQIGELFAFQGLCLVLAQFLVVQQLSKRFKPTKVLRVSLLLSSLSMLIYLFINDAKWIYYAMPITFTALAVNNPNTLSLVSDTAEEGKQGEVMGIRQSIQSIALSITPLFSGFILAINVNGPVIASSLALFISWLIFLRYSKHHR